MQVSRPIALFRPLVKMPVNYSLYIDSKDVLGIVNDRVVARIHVQH